MPSEKIVFYFLVVIVLHYIILNTILIEGLKMKLANTLILLTATVALAACAQTKKEQHTHSHADHHHSHAGHHHHHHGHDHHHDHDHHGHHHAPNYTAWQPFKCDNGKQLKVRYDADMAEVAFNAKQYVLPRYAKNSNSERTAYRNQKWMWSVDNANGYTNTQGRAVGFLTENQADSDLILAKNCEPVK